MESGLDFMTVSLDGATQATYERYRRDGDLNLPSPISAHWWLPDAPAAGRIRSSHGNSSRFEHNAHEIDSAITIARDLGVDQLVVAIPFDVSWDDPGIRPAYSVEPRTINFYGDSERRMIANFAPHHLAEAEIAKAWETGFLRHHEAGRSSHQSAHSCQWLYRNIGGGRHGPGAALLRRS